MQACLTTAREILFVLQCGGTSLQTCEPGQWGASEADYYQGGKWEYLTLTVCGLKLPLKKLS